MNRARPIWEPEEIAAVNAWRQIAYRPTAEERSAGEGGSFGLGIPVLIDPTILIQSQDPAQALPYFTRVVMTTDAWHGVSSAGAALAFKSESAITADAAVTLAQPAIPVYAAAGSFDLSYEMAMDYPGLVNEVAGLFDAAYADMVSNYTAVGSGSSVPTGLFTSMSNQTTSPAHVKVTTAGTLAAADIRAVFGALAPRYQLNASWLLSPSMLQAVAALAAPSVSNGLAPHDYAPASQGQPARLLGRPVLVSSYAPAFTNSTASNVNWMVCGDMTRYLVANRLGSVTLELIPNLPDFTGGTARPTAQRAYYYMNRWGGGVTDPQAFRLLSNS
jgi:HK97 family phage major capsid protein